MMMKITAPLPLLRRFVETAVALCLTFYTLAHLPFLVSVSTEYFSRVSATVPSRIFVFTVLNASILLLSVANSGHRQPQKEEVKHVSSDLQKYDSESDKVDREFVDKFEIAATGNSADESSRATTLVETKELVNVEFDEVEVQKMMIVVVATDDQRSDFEFGVVDGKDYRRTESENLSKDLEEDYHNNSSCKMIYRRSETERCLEMAKAAEDVAAAAAATKEENDQVVDELSNAEFNRIIEAFLEKQKRFHYQENKQQLSSSSSSSSILV